MKRIGLFSTITAAFFLFAAVFAAMPEPDSVELKRTEHLAPQTIWRSALIPVVPNQGYAGKLSVNVLEREPGAMMSVRLVLLDKEKRPFDAVSESSAGDQALFSCGETDYHRYSASGHRAAFMRMEVILSGNPARVEICRATICRESPPPPAKGIYTQKEKLADRKKILEELKKLPVVTVEVLRVPGKRPVLLIDGKETILKSYKGSVDYRALSEAGSNFILTLSAGVNLFWDKYTWDMSPRRPDGTFDFTRLENELLLIHQTAPQARVLLNIDLDPGPDFFASHPNSIMRNEAGQLAVRRYYSFAGFGVPGPDVKKHRHYIVSYGSRDYRDYAVDALRQLGRFLRQSPAGKIVAGFGIHGGHDGQMLQWEYSALRGQADYSPDSLKAFRRFLAERYRNTEELRRAWNDPDVTLDNAQIFSEKEWKSAPVWNAARNGLDRKIIDGRVFMSETIAALNRDFALALKQSIGRPVIVGTYYSSPIWGQAGRSHMKELRRDNAIDLVFQVSAYSFLRKIGGCGASANFTIEAAHRYGLLYLQEMDHRTHRSQMTAPDFYSRTALCYPYDSEEFRKQILRDAGSVLAFGGDGYYFFDMFNSWFNDPDVLRSVRTVNRCADWFLRYRDSVPKNRAAVFLDEKSRLLASNPVGEGFVLSMLCRLSGITADFLLLDNLTDQVLADYRLVIAGNPQTLDSRQLKALEHFAAQPGRVLILTGIPGALNGSHSGSAIPVMAKLGMTVRDIPVPRAELPEFLPNADDPLLSGCAHYASLMPFFCNKAGKEIIVTGHLKMHHQWAPQNAPPRDMNNLHICRFFSRVPKYFFF